MPPRKKLEENPKFVGPEFCPECNTPCVLAESGKYKYCPKCGWGK